MTKTGRLLYLDGLRGIAALVVVFHHVMIAFYPASYTRGFADLHTSKAFEWVLHDTPLGIIINGGFGVAIFLLLSGYVASLQFQNKNSLVLIIESFFKRFVRFLLPILLINVLVYWLLLLDQRWNLFASQYTLSHWWLGAMWKTSASFVTALTQSVGSLFKSYPLTEIYNSSVWTMPFFFLGALLVSTTLYITQKNPLRWIIYLALIYFLLKTHYWLLLVGMMLQHYTLITSPKFGALPIRIVLGFLMLFLGNYPQYYATAELSHWYSWLPILEATHTSTFYHGVAGVMLLILISQSNYLKRILSHKIWLWFGKISFSLYLFHIVVINTLLSWLFIQFISVFSYSMSILLSFLITFPVIVFGSWIIYSISEKRAGAVFQFIRNRLIQ